MKIANSVFELIKSLTKQEKRYFILFASRHILEGEKSEYLKLYEYLEQQPRYDEKKLKKDLAKEPYIKRISVLKNYLYSLIFRSLRQYHSGQSISVQLLEYLFNIEILLGKGLLEQSLRTITLAKKLAKEYEQHLFLLLLSRWEEKLVISQAYNIQLRNDYWENGFVEEAKILERFQLMLQYRKMNLYLSNQKLSAEMHTSHLNKIKLIEKNPAFQKEELAIGDEEKHGLYAIKMNYYYMLGDTRKHRLYLQKNIDLFNRSKILKKQNGMRYMLLLRRLCNLNIIEKKYHMAMDVLKQYKSFSTDPVLKITTRDQVGIKTYYYELEFSILLNTGKLDEVFRLIETIESYIKNNSIINIDEIYIFYYMFSIANFVSQNLDNALEYLNKILNSPHLKKIRVDISFFSQLFALVIYYEMGSHELLLYKIASTKRYMKKTDVLYEIESKLLLQLKHLILKEDKFGKKTILKKIKKTIQSIPLENRLTSSNLDIFQIWIDSKLQNKTILQVIKDK